MSRGESQKRIMRKANFVIQSLKASFFHSFCIVDGDCHVMAGDYADGQQEEYYPVFYDYLLRKVIKLENYLMVIMEFPFL